MFLDNSASLDATVYADSTLAERALGWTATRGLREIISSAYAWHRER